MTLMVEDHQVLKGESLRLLQDLSSVAAAELISLLRLPGEGVMDNRPTAIATGDFALPKPYCRNQRTPNTEGQRRWMVLVLGVRGRPNPPPPSAVAPIIAVAVADAPIFAEEKIPRPSRFLCPINFYSYQ